MLLGEYQHNIDTKGRIIIAAKLREELGAEVVIAKGMENCLFVYSMAEWGILEDKLKENSLTKANERAFNRMFFSGAAYVKLDKQGRILIPDKLRAHAKLAKDIVLIGVASRVEIWDSELWEKYQTDMYQNYENIAESLNS